MRSCFANLFFIALPLWYFYSKKASSILAGAVPPRDYYKVSDDNGGEVIFFDNTFGILATSFMEVTVLLSLFVSQVICPQIVRTTFVCRVKFNKLHRILSHQNSRRRRLGIYFYPRWEYGNITAIECMMTTRLVTATSTNRVLPNILLFSRSQNERRRNELTNVTTATTRLLLENQQQQRQQISA
jgi:hypothetical protein